MKKTYRTLECSGYRIESESPILSSSVEPVQEIKLEVEVDEYINIDTMDVTFE